MGSGRTPLVLHYDWTGPGSPPHVLSVDVGLVDQIEKGTATKDQNCGMCEFNTLISQEEYRAFIKTLTGKHNGT